MMASPRELFRDSKLFVYAVVATLMSGYDAGATLQHMARGVAEEANPLMESLIERDIVLFVLVKMAFTVGGLLICYRCRHLPAARLGIRLAVVIYSLICVYHALIMILL